MRLRADLADRPAGPEREAALRAYVARASIAPRLVDASPRREEARRAVLLALEAESQMLRTERLRRDERDAALGAVRRARDACYGPSATTEGGR
jgi:hypothetical protein